MARALSSQKVFHQLTGVYFMSDHADTSLLTDAPAIGGKVLNVTTAEGTKFSVGDICRIGSNGNLAEVNMIESIATDELTFRLPFHRALTIGEAITQLTPNDLGATDENGVNLETTQGENAIIAGTQKSTYLFIPQNVEEALTFALRDFEKENLAQSLGLDESAAGIVDSNGVVLNPNNFGALSHKPWKMEGLLEDGTAVTAIIYAAKVGSANQTLQFVHGQAAIIPFALRSIGARSFLFI